MTSADQLLMHTLASVAPGTQLRDGLERILRGRTGALIVVGMDETVESICTGGFHIDVEFSATRLRELAKMDGAIVLDAHRTRILRAAVQLVPDPTIDTAESGTRHRTADRVAQQTGYPVISVSQSMHTVALYAGTKRRILENPDSILTRGNQALATLERYKLRLDEVTSNLSALEIENLATIRDVAAVAQRLEMVRRISDEITSYVVELGVDGRLLSLQLDELTGGIAPERQLLIRDYVPTDRESVTVSGVLDALSALSASQLVELGQVARVMHLDQGRDLLDSAVCARGYRLLSKVPRLPVSVLDRLVNHFDDLQKLLAAPAAELAQVGGVSADRAQSLREGLSRLAESLLV